MHTRQSRPETATLRKACWLAGPWLVSGNLGFGFSELIRVTDSVQILCTNNGVHAEHLFLSESLEFWYVVGRWCLRDWTPIKT